jgi:hypothetical protein
MLKCTGLEFVTDILVSSTNNIGTESLFIILRKSLIYKRNSSVPKMEPRGTLCLFQTLKEYHATILLIVY